MTIAILGGRFDPPHWGHYWVGRQVLDYQPTICKVWFIPAAQHQWKPTVASAHDRLAMVKLMAKATKQFTVSDCELKRGGISYTVDTIREIKNQFHHTIYWIVGADIISEFNRWENREELTNLATFLVFPRDPYTIPSSLPAGFKLMKAPSLIVSNLSSTHIRDRIKNGKSIHGFVPDAVKTYINNKGLYQ